VCVCVQKMCVCASKQASERAGVRACGRAGVRVLCVNMGLSQSVCTCAQRDVQARFFRAQNVLKTVCPN